MATLDLNKIYAFENAFVETYFNNYVTMDLRSFSGKIFMQSNINLVDSKDQHKCFIVHIIENLRASMSKLYFSEVLSIYVHTLMITLVNFFVQV